MRVLAAGLERVLGDDEQIVPATGVAVSVAGRGRRSCDTGTLTAVGQAPDYLNDGSSPGVAAESPRL